MSSLDEVISAVIAEESSRGVMLELHSINSSTLILHGSKPYLWIKELSHTENLAPSIDNKDNL